MRRCIDCDQELPLDAFYRHGNGRHWLTRCKPCHNARSLRDQQARRERDPEAYHAQRRSISARSKARRRGAADVGSGNAAGQGTTP